MIVSKNALQVVNLTAPDKQVPLLDTVHIREDGGIVAANRDVVILVSPVKEEVKGAYPLKSRETEEVTISSDSIRDIIKYIGVDKRFGGLLDNCDIVKKGEKVEVMCYDGQRTKVFEGKCYPEYFEYMQLLTRVCEDSNNIRVVLNVKRLKALIDTIDKVCMDRGDFAPIFFEFTNSGDILIRAVDAKIGTRVMAVIRSLPGSKFLDYSAWEKQFLKRKPEAKTIPVRKRFTRTKNFKVAKEEIEMSKPISTIISKSFVRKRKTIKKEVYQWKIINDTCPKCGNHLRRDSFSGVIKCSYINCKDFVPDCIPS